MAKALILVLALLCPGTAGAASYSVSSSGSLSAGRFGDTQETRVAASSIGIRTQIGNWEIGASLPYLSIETGATGAVAVGGTIVGTGEARRGRRSGYGDISFRLSRQLPLGDSIPFQARLTASTKLPTGANGLTTGKLDSGLSLEVSRSFGRVTPFASAGYRTYGNTRLVRLRDGWATSAGVMALFGRVTLIASHETAQTLVDGPGSREFFAAASTPVGQGWAWTLFGSKGYSAGSANLMVGTALTRSIQTR